MYLEEFIKSCDEMFQDNGIEEGPLPSPHLAKTVGAYLVELIERGFDVFPVIELIFYENSFYEQRQGFQFASSEEEIPF